MSNPDIKHKSSLSNRSQPKNEFQELKKPCKHEVYRALAMIKVVKTYFTSSKLSIYDYQVVMFLWYKYDTDIAHANHRLHCRL